MPGQNYYNTPTYVAINAASAGDNIIVAGVAGQQIRVLHYVLKVAGAVVVKWYSGSSSGTALSGAMSCSGAGDGISTPAARREDGLLQCNAGDNLVLNLGGAVQVSGHLAYASV